MDAVQAKIKLGGMPQPLKTNPDPGSDVGATHASPI